MNPAQVAIPECEGVRVNQNVNHDRHIEVLHPVVPVYTKYANTGNFSARLLLMGWI